MLAVGILAFRSSAFYGGNAIWRNCIASDAAYCINRQRRKIHLWGNIRRSILFSAVADDKAKEGAALPESFRRPATTSG